MRSLIVLSIPSSIAPLSSSERRRLRRPAGARTATDGTTLFPTDAVDSPADWSGQTGRVWGQCSLHLRLCSAGPVLPTDAEGSQDILSVFGSSEMNTIFNIKPP